MEQTCRIAVVGAGPLVGLHHCNAIAGMKEAGVELACICDVQPQTVAERYGVPGYVDAREMTRAEHLSGIIVATPTHLHLPMVEACIEGALARSSDLGEPSLALRTILVEKPICEDLRSSLRLIRLAAAAGVEILVGHQRRHSAFSKRARELVTHDNFGRLRGLTGEFALLKPDSYFLDEDPKTAWRGHRGKGGPVLINLIHDVDLLRYITNCRVASVFAALGTTARDNEVEDTGAVTLVFDNGAVGSFFFSDATPSPWSYEFTSGENKKYPPVPGAGPKDCYHFMGGRQSLGFPSLQRFGYDHAAGEPGWDSPLSLDELAVSREDPIVVQMCHFVRVCRGEEKPICSGEDGMESLAIILAVLDSAEKGAAVRPSDLLETARQQA